MRSLSILLMLLVPMLVASCALKGSAESAATKIDKAAGDVAIAAKVVKDAASSFKPPPPKPDGSTDYGAWAAGIISAIGGGLAAWQATRGKAKKDAAPVANAFNAVVDTIEEAPDEIKKADLLAAMSAHPRMDGPARIAVAAAKAR